MKITWEPEDIQPGRRVRKPGCNETWIVGYDPSCQGKDAQFALISLNDGMISRRGLSADEMAIVLNDTESHPVELVDATLRKGAA